MPCAFNTVAGCAASSMSRAACERPGWHRRSSEVIDLPVLNEVSLSPNTLGQLLRLPLFAETKILTRQIVGRIHGDRPLQGAAGFLDAARLEEAPPKVVDKRLIIRFKLQCPFESCDRLLMAFLVAGTTSHALMQNSGGGEPFDGAPEQLQSVLVCTNVDEKTPGLVNDLAQVRRVLG